MSTCRYEHKTTITGLKETISALEFSPDGKGLTSGCEDGSITIFSKSDWKPLHMFTDVLPSTSLVWHPQVEGLLFCGFKSGDVHTLRTNGPQASIKIWTDASRRPINCLSHDPGRNVLAVGSGKDTILANYSTQDEYTASWSKTCHLPPPPGLPQLHATKLPDPAAQSIHFLQGQDLLVVSYLHHGVMLGFIRYFLYSSQVTTFVDAGIGLLCLLSGKSRHGHVKWYLTFSYFPSGQSCLIADQGVIAITNLFDGVDLYDLTNQGLVDSLRTTIVDNIITPIVSGRADLLIIGGSCGAVQWPCLKPLKDGKIVQALAYISKSNGRCLLAAGTSELGPQTVITIWRSKQDCNQIIASGPKEIAVALWISLRKMFIAFLGFF
ncbi:hypothetical protein BDM02DRAFT_3132669 [Thelephora ganbajun]|uniref:Uncharacterized protein n=1 Tax=Thelephora ganbajun TaxID=370292 RepID=A0ACB6Z059_THEGA|nr:hypothetical protein BDM02DRAFT_3132669 [Thelephora ganbajun]